MEKTQYGNIVKGFDKFRGSSSSVPTPSAKPQDRIFSNSSETSVMQNDKQNEEYIAYWIISIFSLIIEINSWNNFVVAFFIYYYQIEEGNLHLWRVIQTYNCKGVILFFVIANDTKKIKIETD